MLKKKITAVAAILAVALLSLAFIGKDDAAQRPVVKKVSNAGIFSFASVSGLFSDSNNEIKQDRIDLAPILDNPNLPDERRDAFLDADANNDGFLDPEEALGMRVGMQKRNKRPGDARGVEGQPFDRSFNPPANRPDHPGGEFRPDRHEPWEENNVQSHQEHGPGPAPDSDEALWGELLAELASYVDQPAPDAVNTQPEF